MLVRITAGRGIGQVLDMPNAVAQARIAGGTAVAVGQKTEIAMLEQSSRGERMQRARAPEPDQAKRRKR